MDDVKRRGGKARGSDSNARMSTPPEPSTPETCNRKKTDKSPKPIAKAAPPRCLLHDGLYPIEDAKRVLGWTNSAYRGAVRRGLPVLRDGKRGYLSGKDVLEYLRRITANTQKKANSAEQSNQTIGATHGQSVQCCTIPSKLSS